MCRVLLGEKKDLLEYDDSYSLEYLLAHLEKEAGGHGNGLVLVRNRKIVYFEKGLHFTARHSYEAMVDEDYDIAIWHTRIASVGQKSDKNCHPYVYGNSCLAMNGTEYDFLTLASFYNTTDTEAIFRSLFIAGNPQNATHVAKFLSENMESVFVGCLEGVPFVAKGSGQLAQWSGHCLFASSFPTRLFRFLDTKKLGRGYSVNCKAWKNVSIYDATYPYSYYSYLRNNDVKYSWEYYDVDI